MLAVLAPDHPLAGRETVEVRDLAGDTWTAPSRDHLVYRACVAAGFEPRIAFVTRDVLAARGLVASGLAVTMMPELLASGLPGIAMVPLDGPQPSRSLYALTAGGRRARRRRSHSSRRCRRRSSLSAAMATPSTSQPTPQRLAAIREQLSLLADYL